MSGISINQSNDSSKNMDEITAKDILNMRTALDTSSWSPYRETDEEKNIRIVRVDFINRYLIESFDWFGLRGLEDIFKHYEFKTSDGTIIYIVDPILHYPTKSTASDKSGVPMFPMDARLNKLDYSGALVVRLEIHRTDLQGGLNKEPYVTDPIPFGTIPIMVGSRFCNLTRRDLVPDVQRLKELKECPDSLMGYFIINGNPLHLISQNYLKVNRPICIMSKMSTTGSGNLVMVCDLRSKSLSGPMYRQRVFIMNHGKNKLESGDRRIYCQLDSMFRKNAYDRSETVIGANVISIYRLSYILTVLLNPFRYKNEYLNSDLKQGNYLFKGGHNQQSTFHVAAETFSQSILKFANAEVYDLVRAYRENTTNEASLETEELVFWNAMIKITTPSSQNSKAKTSVDDLADQILTTFGRIFMPHVSASMFSKQKRDLEDYAKRIRFDIVQLLKPTQINDPNMVTITRVSNIEQDVELALQYITARYKGIDFRIMMGGDREGFPEEQFNNMMKKINSWKLEEYLQTSQNVINATHLYKMFTNEMETKLDMFSYMIVKVLRIEMEADNLDDRDSLANQMYEHPGIMMSTRLSSMLKDIADEIKKKTFVENTIKKAFEAGGNDVIKHQFESNFRQGEWNKPGNSKKRTGVTGNMPPSNLAAQSAALRRLSSNATGLSKVLDSREITGLHPGFVCPSDTPEGQQCGKISHLAAVAFINTSSYDNVTWGMKLAQKLSNRRPGSRGEILTESMLDISVKFVKSMTSNADIDMNEEEKLLYPISRMPTPLRNCPLFLNGTPIGWVEGLKMRNLLISSRRRGIMHPFTGIHYRQKVGNLGVIRSLTIDTTGGRILQPLIIAEDPKKTFDMLWGLYMKAKGGHPSPTVSDLFEEGYIEFIDPAEMEFLDLAPSASDYLRSIQKGIPNRYDHIMLNPAFLMGITANLQPFSSMNPNVRNSYFTSMAKQPSDAASPSFIMRADTGVAQLLTAQKPIVSTDIYDAAYNTDYFGKNIQVLLVPDRDGEEDGIVVRRSFVENGGLSSKKYSAFSMALSSKSKLDFGEQFYEQSNLTDPDRYGKGVILAKRKVTTVDPDTGISTTVDKSVIVRPGDVLAREMDSVRDQETYSNLEFDSLRDGEVDRIMWSESDTGTRNVYVVISFLDSLWLGDKIANRHSQKGVIVKVIDDDDMYRDAETGEMPDIIVNPQALPSRMTVGMMAEMTVSNAHIWPDMNQTVPILFKDKGFDIFVPLERLYLIGKQPLNRFENDMESHEKLSPVSYPSESVLPTSSLMQTTSGQRASSTFQNTSIEMISSESVFNDKQAEYLNDNDQGLQWASEGQEGIYAMRIYGTPVVPEDMHHENHGSGVMKDVLPTGDIRYGVIIVDDSLSVATTLKIEDTRIQALYRISPQLRARIVYVIGIPTRMFENIPDLYMGGQLDKEKQRIPMKGIRLSNLPKTPLTVQENPLSHLGNTVQDVYIAGNPFTPVANNYIIEYLPHFFTRPNIEFYFIDYVIPDNMLLVPNVKFPGQNQFGDIMLPRGITKLSTLKQERKEIKALEIKAPGPNDDPDGPEISVEITTTLYEMWIRTYPYFDPHLDIDRSLIINLPNTPREIFQNRRRIINNLRKATAFKEGMDLHDAKNELAMLGYNMDMKRTFRKGKNGPLVKGGLISGYNYYMAMPQKVLNKIQCRGDEGRYDIKNGQPNRGRNNGGGLRFNNADASAVRRTGAYAVVADRLLHASGKVDVFMCQNCNLPCYKLGPTHKDSGTIVCRTCDNPKIVKVQVPYSFIYMRNLMMGAGVQFQMKTKAIDNKLNE
jgi:DNA-directed RNA polymerase beta subunit